MILAPFITGEFWGQQKRQKIMILYQDFSGITNWNIKIYNITFENAIWNNTLHFIAIYTKKNFGPRLIWQQFAFPFTSWFLPSLFSSMRPFFLSLLHLFLHYWGLSSVLRLGKPFATKLHMKVSFYLLPYWTSLHTKVGLEHTL